MQLDPQFLYLKRICAQICQSSEITKPHETLHAINRNSESFAYTSQHIKVQGS